MIWQGAEQIADALLYEGYLLYPYRASAVKNRYRWQFGVVGPPGAEELTGPSFVQTQCLVEPKENPVLDLKIRFLQAEAGNGADWDEAHPRELSISDVSLKESFANQVHSFVVEGAPEVELSCVVRLSVESAGEYRKLTVRIENVTAWQPEKGAPPDRPAALRRSLVGAHTLLAVRDGAFVSLLDPPAHAAERVAECANVRTWPVLVGGPPERTLMLSAPIILYDYPSVAPESPGDLFDATEIDEILTLRVLTLTDAERQEACATDPRARQIIERAAALSPAALERLHGAIRTPDGVSAWEAFLNPPTTDTDDALDGGGRRITTGARVRLAPHPERRADAMDMFLAGETATVAEICRDLEDRVHVAVTVDASKADDLHAANGRYYYFRPDEVEVLDAAPPIRSARVLVAGIGNMFLGDDGFGCAVIQRLASRSFPEWVKVQDFGIGSIHLAYDLLERRYETTIIVDALARGDAPGTLYVLEPDVDGVPAQPADAHTLTVESVLGFLKHIGGTPGRVVVVGCEAASVAPEMGLSDAVTAAIDGAVELVMSLIAKEER
jgi:hydrogenase maturation protease